MDEGCKVERTSFTILVSKIESRDASEHTPGHLSTHNDTARLRARYQGTGGNVIV
jgi:hypothetical protein